MKSVDLFPTVSVAVLTSVLLVTSCSTMKQTAPNPPPVVTLEKKPTWLVLGGLEGLTRTGDIVHVGGKTLELEGWIFENDDPEHDNLVISSLVTSSMRGTIYWKGKGTIINPSHERVKLPLPSSEDPRSDAEREANFEERTRGSNQLELIAEGPKIRIRPWPHGAKATAYFSGQ